MATMGAGQDNAGLLPTTLGPWGAGYRPGVLIVGARRGDVFVATEVLIAAETLGDEEAVRAWLAQHDIHLDKPTPQHRARPQGLHAGGRLSGDTGRNADG
jgi:hypothetical protein